MIPFLESTRLRVDILFMYTLLLNSIDCDELIAKLNFYVPSRISRKVIEFFYVKPYNTEFALQSSINKILSLCNENRDWLEL